jgi:hypothetical protein
MKQFFLPKNIKALRPGLIFSIFCGETPSRHISRKKTGKKYWLGAFWQKLIKQSIFTHILPNKTSFCQKQPRKVTRQRFFSK